MKPLRRRRGHLGRRGVAQWNKHDDHELDTHHQGAQVTRESAVDAVVLRDTAGSNAAGLHSAAHSDRSWARPYVIAVLVAGCLALVVSVSELWAMQPPVQWWALVALTLISGSAVLKIPAVPVNFSISDVFTLTSAVMFGPAAGTVMVAIDSLMISGCLVRTGLPLERILFNAAAPPVAMWLSAIAFFNMAKIQPLYAQPLGLEVVGLWLLVFAALYFFLNTLAIAVAVALHERVNAITIWRTHFQNLWFTFIGGGLGAAFVVFALQLGTYGMALLALPLLLAVILHFAYRNATGRVADQLQHLAEVNRLHLSTIEALARAVDAKDGVTHGHIRRVQNQAIALATRLGVDDQLQLRAMEAAALLHDVGKLAIPEHILNKPGKLTPAEFERMKSHARIGAEILSEVDFPYPVVPIVRHHHENWDGTGYPDGLKGSDIPIGARILAVVDCFDALTSDRPYRRALSVHEAFEIVDARRGTMYDPAIVDAFREMCDSSASTEVEPPIEQVETTRTLAAPPCASSEAVAGDAPAETCDEIRLAMELGASLSSSLRAPCSWGVLAERLCDLPGVDTVAVFVVDDAEQQLIPRHVSGAHAQHVKQLSIPVGDRLSGWVAAVEQPMINADATLDLFDADAPALRSALAISCEGPDVARTVVTLYSIRTGAFSALHQRLVEGAAAMLSQRATAPAVEPHPFHGTPRRLCRQKPRIDHHATPSTSTVDRKRRVA
jgi:putative nucleotidyltransferase with HDIG domain